MEITADWIMVHGKDGDTYQGVKKRNGEKIMRVSELQEMATDSIEEGYRNHEAYHYLFNDLLVVQQGVFRWNNNTNSFKKVSDHYDKISEPIPLCPKSMIKIESVHLTETEKRYEVTLNTDQGVLDLVQFPKAMKEQATRIITSIGVYHRIPVTTKYLGDENN